MLIPMILMPFLGAWYIGSMQADSRAWATGGSVPMTMFFTIAVGSSALVGFYGLVALWYGRLVDLPHERNRELGRTNGGKYSAIA